MPNISKYTSRGCPFASVEPSILEHIQANCLNGYEVTSILLNDDVPPTLITNLTLGRTGEFEDLSLRTPPWGLAANATTN